MLLTTLEWRLESRCNILESLSFQPNPAALLLDKDIIVTDNITGNHWRAGWELAHFLLLHVAVYLSLTIDWWGRWRLKLREVKWSAQGHTATCVSGPLSRWFHLLAHFVTFIKSFLEAWSVGQTVVQQAVSDFSLLLWMRLVLQRQTWDLPRSPVLDEQLASLSGKGYTLALVPTLPSFHRTQ